MGFVEPKRQTRSLSLSLARSAALLFFEFERLVRRRVCERASDECVPRGVLTSDTQTPVARGRAACERARAHTFSKLTRYRELGFSHTARFIIHSRHFASSNSF